MTDGAPRAALADALGLLGRRDFTEAAMRARLLKRHHEEASVEHAIAKCVGYGYIDDHAWGAARAAELFRRRPLGRTALLHDLRRYGLAPTMAEQVANEAYAGRGGERAVLTDALQRWVAGKGAPTEWSSIRRCSGHLQRRGFAAGDIQAALSPWLDELAARHRG